MSNTQTYNLTGTQKIAILLMAMSKDNANRFISLFDDEEIERISEAMVGLGYIKPDVVESVFIEFMHDVNGFSGICGHEKSVYSILSDSVGNERADSIVNAAKRSNTDSVWEKMEGMDTHKVLNIITREHPQTSAAILAHLSSHKASMIISLLSKEYALEVVRRMLKMKDLERSKVRQLEEALENEISSSVREQGDRRTIIGDSEHANCKVIADILDNLVDGENEKILEQLAMTDGDAVEYIQSMMFSFDDVVKIGHDGLQMLLQVVDKGTMSKALKGGNKSVVSLFLGRISQRASRLLMEDIRRIEATPAEIKMAQSEVAKMAKKLISEGKIALIGGN